MRLPDFIQANMQRILDDAVDFAITQAPEGAQLNHKRLRNDIPLILRDIVAETTEIIEKMCIETALDLTGNNRVAAAELLSLSRQSLYVKLRKFGIAGLFVFVFAPFWMTGPVVGAIIGW